MLYGNAKKEVLIVNSCVSEKGQKQLKKNHNAYIIEAALEYFIALLTTGTFLTAILINIGVSDSVAGIVTSFASLGFVAQFFSVIFIKPKGAVKTMVTIMHFVNQLMFVVLYLIPYINVPSHMKVIVFAVMYLGGNLLHYTAFPFKIDWLMSYVPDNERGYFTANKEIVSLLGGMIFSFLMGYIIDYFKAIGNEEMGFVLSGITIFVLCILHLISLVVVKDPEGSSCAETQPSESHTIKSILGITLFDKKMSKIILLDVMWHVATGISTAYFAIYAQKSMGITVVTISVIVAIQSITRVFVSKFFGKIADKYSWAKMLTISFFIGAIGFIIFGFATPENCFTVTLFGSSVKLNIFHIIYYIISGIYAAGANSGIINITFDYASYENRRYALGIKSAIGGLAAFLATTAVAPFVNMMQNNGNKIFGITIYSQQILAFSSGIIFLLIVFYIRKVIFNIKKTID